MVRGVRMPGAIEDGRAAWAEFVSGVARTFEGGEAAAGVLALILIALLVIWVDYRFSKWLLRRRGARRGGD